MATQEIQEAAGYYIGEPDVKMMSKWFYDTHLGLTDWLDECDDNFNTRFLFWRGKSNDGRKHAREGEEPFPWDLASDMEVPLIDETVQTRKALLINALRKANIMANPSGGDDLERARMVSGFLKWMVSTLIKEFYEEAEVGADHFLQRGLMATGTFYQKHQQKTLLPVTLAGLVREIPEIGELIQSGTEDIEGELATMLQTIFDTNKKRAKKAAKELVEDGESQMPVTVTNIDRPVIKNFSMDEDLFLPQNTANYQRVPYMFSVDYMTPEEMREKVISDDWDEDWVEYMVDRKPRSEIIRRTTQRIRDADGETRYEADSDNLGIQVFWCYQRLTDPDDNVPGIWETIFHPEVRVENGYDNDQDYGKHGLLGYAHGEYPFTITRKEKFSKRLYDTRGDPEQGKGFQDQKKVQIDSLNDRTSLTTLPELLCPPNRLPRRRGPGVKIPARPGERWEYMEAPRFDPAMTDIQATIEKQTNTYFGRNATDVDPKEAQWKQQSLINNFLAHWVNVIDQSFSLFEQYGPEETWFSVVGLPGSHKFDKVPGERMDFNINFDVLSEDDERTERIFKSFMELAKTAPAGNFDWEEFMVAAGNYLDPVLAHRFIVPNKQAEAKATDEEEGDLAKIYAGVPIDVREIDNHETKLQVQQTYMQQPDVQARMAQDPNFKERLEKRYQQRSFQIEQRQVNAQIGRIGSKPQAMQGQQ